MSSEKKRPPQPHEPGVSAYYLADGKVRYSVQWWDSRRIHRRKSGFTTVRDAKRFKREQLSAKDHGRELAYDAAHVTVQSLSEEWLAMRRNLIKLRTWEAEESHHRVHIVPYWGNTLVKDIRFSDVQTWIADLIAEELAPKTVHNIYADFAALIKYAIRDRLIAINPCEGIKLPKIPPRNMVFLTPEQLNALADASGYFRPYVLTLGTCGLRDGEARALRVRNIDWDKHRITVASTMERTNSAGWIENAPKTWEAREVPIPARTFDALKELCTGKAPDDFVFRQPNGDMMPQQSRSKVAKKDDAYQWFGKAILDSGVPSLRIHDLRHTTASIAISAGANVKGVQKLLGHKDARETLNTYAALFERDLDDVAVRMDAAMRGDAPSL